jgi:hypothetical protein
MPRLLAAAAPSLLRLRALANVGIIASVGTIVIVRKVAPARSRGRGDRVALAGRSPLGFGSLGFGELELELGPNFGAFFASGYGPMYIELKSIDRKRLNCNDISCAENLVA